jgi:uncharacterized membrane protein YgcG
VPEPPAPRMIRSICCFVFRPKRFVRIAEDFSDRLSEFHKAKTPTSSPPSYSEEQTRTLRRALGESVTLVLVTVVIGIAIGMLLQCAVGAPSTWTARIVAYAGTGLLLWATLGVAGWSIRSWKGETLPERVEEWIIRALHLFGTFLLVISLTWQAAATFG